MELHNRWIDRFRHGGWRRVLGTVGLLIVASLLYAWQHSLRQTVDADGCRHAYNRARTLADTAAVDRLRIGGPDPRYSGAAETCRTLLRPTSTRSP